MKRWNCPSCGGLVTKTRHPDGLLAAKACRIDGACVFCEKPLTGIKRVICGSRGCRRAYIAAYLRDRRFAQRAA